MVEDRPLFVAVVVVMGAEATEDATAAAPVTVEEVEERVQHGKNPPSARHKKPRPHPNG